MAQNTINDKQRITDPCIVPVNMSREPHTPAKLLGATLTRNNIPIPKNSTLPDKVGAYWSDKNKRSKEYCNLPNNLTRKSTLQPITQKDQSHLIISGRCLGDEDLKIILDRLIKTNNIQSISSHFYRWAEGNPWTEGRRYFKPGKNGSMETNNEHIPHRHQGTTHNPYQLPAQYLQHLQPLDNGSNIPELR